MWDLEEKEKIAAQLGACQAYRSGEKPEPAPVNRRICAARLIAGGAHDN
jgi:hypothetical protein